MRGSDTVPEVYRSNVEGNHGAEEIDEKKSCFFVGGGTTQKEPLALYWLNPPTMYLRRGSGALTGF